MMKNRGGRPTLFDKSMVKKAKEYIGYFQQSEESQQAHKNSRTNPIEVIHSVGGLARYLDVHRSTLYEWAKINKEFSDTLDALQDIQEVIALNNGLIGKFSAPITKLILANHGYSDKQNIKMTVDPLSALIDEIGREARGCDVDQEEDRS